jgi:taurine dioxygenase
LKITALHQAVGVELSGLDLGPGLDDDDLDALRGAAHRHGVVVCREQTLSPADEMALARRLGEPLPGYRLQYGHPEFPDLVRIGNIEENGRVVTYLNTGGIEWHTDSPGSGKPPGYTMLHCLESEIPDGGGETWFASTVTGYRALTDDLRARLEDVMLVHSFNTFNDLVADYEESRVPAQHGALRTRNLDTRDPVVQAHPATGETHLYLAHAMVKEIPGRGFEEGMALVMEVVERITRPELVYRHAWAPGDVAVFDNRSCLHTPTLYAWNDYPRTRRLLHQVIIGAREG